MWRLSSTGIRIITKIASLVLLAAPILYVSIHSIDKDSYWDFVRQNYLVFFGMPYAAFFAYFLVSTLESNHGPIEAKLPGFEFKGASGPLVFWILVFLAVMGSFKMLWKDVSTAPQKPDPIAAAPISISNSASGPASPPIEKSTSLHDSKNTTATSAAPK